jgi:hypothetical protein
MLTIADEPQSQQNELPGNGDQSGAKMRFPNSNNVHREAVIQIYYSFHTNKKAILLLFHLQIIDTYLAGLW